MLQVAGNFSKRYGIAAAETDSYLGESRCGGDDHCNDRSTGSGKECREDF